MLQLALLGLPTTSVTGLQLMGLPPSVKATVPAAALPATLAMKVTVVPAATGLPDVDSVVVVGTGPLGVAVVQASIPLRREYDCSALVILTRMRSVVNGVRWKYV